MTELKKGDWSSFVSSGKFTIPEDGILELDGQSCTILDGDGNEVGNLNATRKESKALAGHKGFVIRGKLLLK
jgi:hypothetical protein